MNLGLDKFPPYGEWDSKRWPNFSVSEFVCKCGGKYCKGEYFHDPAFLDKLQAMRTLVGKSFKINSGRRCRGHNTAITSRPTSNSMHTLAIAADIALAGHDHEKLLDAAHEVEFMGIGLAATFIHVDNRPAFAMWDYGKESRIKWGISSTPWELAR